MLAPVPTSQLSPGQSGLRFLIELAALAGWTIAGWNMTDSGVRWLLAAGLPVAAAAIWGTFRTPGDASANGEAPVAVSGPVRLGLELDVLLGAAIAVAVFWRADAGLALGVLVVAHDAMTISRIRWLLSGD